MKKVKVKEIILSDKERIELYEKIKNEIITQLINRKVDGDIGDIGNEIGYAVGKHIANKNIVTFEASDFIDGFEHGYSIQDETHG